MIGSLRRSFLSVVARSCWEQVHRLQPLEWCSLSYNVYRTASLNYNVFRAPSLSYNIFRTPSLIHNVFRKPSLSYNVFRILSLSYKVYGTLSLSKTVFRTLSQNHNAFRTPLSHKVFRTHSLSYSFFWAPSLSYRIIWARILTLPPLGSCSLSYRIPGLPSIGQYFLASSPHQIFLVHKHLLWDVPLYIFPLLFLWFLEDVTPTPLASDDNPGCANSWQVRSTKGCWLYGSGFD